MGNNLLAITANRENIIIEKARQTHYVVTGNLGNKNMLRV